MTDLPGKDAKPLEGVEKDRWDALKGAVSGLSEAIVEGAITEETLTASLNQIGQVKLDLQTVLNSVHVPEDAGEYEEGLRRIMARIPDGWGRWVSCDKGWYPMLIELDERLATIAPDYEVNQVKEKYGTLRYYIGLPYHELGCCTRFHAEHPHPTALHGTLEYEEAWQNQTRLIDEHVESVEHLAAEADFEPERVRREAIFEEMNTIIAEYEDRSAVTCESCGKPGELKVDYGWYSTKCDECRDAQ